LWGGGWLLEITGLGIVDVNSLRFKMGNGWRVEDGMAVRKCCVRLFVAVGKGRKERVDIWFHWVYEIHELFLPEVSFSSFCVSICLLSLERSILDSEI